MTIIVPRRPVTIIIQVLGLLGLDKQLTYSWEAHYSDNTRLARSHKRFPTAQEAAAAGLDLFPGATVTNPY